MGGGVLQREAKVREQQTGTELSFKEAGDTYFSFKRHREPMIDPQRHALIAVMAIAFVIGAGLWLWLGRLL